MAVDIDGLKRLMIKARNADAAKSENFYTGMIGGWMMNSGDALISLAERAQAAEAEAGRLRQHLLDTCQLMGTAAGMLGGLQRQDVSVNAGLAITEFLARHETFMEWTKALLALTPAASG